VFITVVQMEAFKMSAGLMTFGTTTKCNRERGDPVSLLKGCGKVTTQKLNAHGIYTYQLLLDYKGDIPNINLNHLRMLARTELKNTKEISAHNWKDRVCHVIRAKGHVTRGIIENLVIGPYRVMLNVRWVHKGRIHRRQVSPIGLICAQVLWLSFDIVSDDSDSDSCDPMESLLPKFLVDTQNPQIESLSHLELQGIQSVVKETNQLYNCIHLQKLNET
jgi:hypothetical protein